MQPSPQSHCQTEFGQRVQSAMRSRLKREDAFANDALADDLHTLRVYSKDLWPRNLITSRESELPDPTIDLVFWPASIHELSEFICEANLQEWELYPYGAGSGVCGGATVPAEGHRRKRIVVDLKRLDAVESIDETSQVAKVQAGILGQVLEERLNARGYTMGHFPSSIYCSAFGGYLATRAAGQLSTYYGKIEDMVLAVEGVLPNGEVFSTSVAPRSAVGPDWNHVFVGSEGVLGFLTAAWVKIHRMAEKRAFLSYHVESSAAALDGVRQWMQMGLRPAAVRIYDEDESRLLMGLKDGVKLVSVVEGESEFVDFTAAKMARMAATWSGWHDTGEEPAEHWWAHRYDVSYRQQQVMSHRRMILDTFEVSATWSGLVDLHRAVKAVTKSSGIDGMLVILAHFSHFYHTGANIYFTLAGRAGEEGKTAEFYDRVWEEMLAACLKQGAAVSHHHGIGRLKSRAMMSSRGPLFGLFEKLKNEMDQKHLLNPTNMGL